MKVLKNLLWIGSLILYVFLVTHHSEHPRFLSRYSTKFFLFLTAYPIVLGFLWIVTASRWRKGLGAAVSRAISYILDGKFIKRHYWKFFAALVLIHVLMVFRYMPPGMFFTKEPLLRTDFAHHYHQVEVTVKAMADEGKCWAYNPSFCAGYPEGTIFDVDMKFIELATFLLSRTGLDVALVYNLTVLSFFLLPPFLLLMIGRNFLLTRRMSLLVIASGILLWHALPLMVVFNASGMCSFVFGTYWALLVLSVFYRFLNRPGALNSLALFGSLAVGFSIHILMVLLLAFPMLVMLASAWKSLTLKRQLYLAVIVLGAAGANLWWIVPVLHFMCYRVNTTFFEPASLSQFIITIFKQRDDSFVLAFLGVWGFLATRNRYPRLAVVGITTLLWYYALAYLTPNIALLRNLELKRFTVSGSIISLFGFTMGLVYGARQYRVIGANLFQWLPILIIFLTFVTRLLLPQTLLKSPFENEKKYMQPLVEWVRANTSDEGRIAFMDQSPGSMTGAKLQNYTGREFIGGPFCQMNMVHSHASFTYNRFFDKQFTDITAKDIQNYTDQYNIHWLITTSFEAYNVFCQFPAQLKPVQRMLLYWGKGPTAAPLDSPFKFYARPDNEFSIGIFEVTNPPTPFIKGSGKIHAQLNRIAVNDAGSSVTVIKYHWLPTLAVDPPMPIKKYAIAGDPVGFIQVDNGGTRNFTIYNGYKWPAKPSY